MPIQRFTGRVSDTERVGAKFVHLHIELEQPDVIDYQAGQYVMVDVPGVEIKKHYSIASEPEMNHAIELLIDTSPTGPGTHYLVNLKPGELMNFFAPAGHFIVDPLIADGPNPEKALAFVASGSGIAPIRGMIRDLLQTKHDSRKIMLYWGLRFEEDICWLDEFREFEKSFPNFTLHMVLSKAGAEWPLCRGHVTDCLSIHPMLDSAGYYVCGNKQMITDTEALLLSKNVPKEHIHHEEFY
ncbi:MAG TPA: FAD-binding oxidoreductase [Candidatus Saccharimonadia bacterium]|nr:FAD-binding oxidoreductase [Candidatus Saccharimonadia bacterium]